MLSYPNGITTAYEYDAASRLTEIDYQIDGGSLDTLTYDYDLNGNRTSLGFGNTLQAEAGLVSSATYNVANQMLLFDDFDQTYDDFDMQYEENGNMTLFRLMGSGFMTLDFNARNQLEEINGYGSMQVYAKFRYDALGRRIEKTVDGVTTKYVYDGLDVVAEVTGAGAVKYVRTLNMDEPLARIQPRGQVTSPSEPHCAPPAGVL